MSHLSSGGPFVCVCVLVGPFACQDEPSFVSSLPSEFETAAGIQPGRKWKKSIKCKGKPIGEWLDANGPKSSSACDYSKDPFSLSETFSQELDENPDTELQMSEGQGDIQPTQKQAMSGSLYTKSQVPDRGPDVTTIEHRMETMEKTVSTLLNLIDQLQQEMKDKETQHKNNAKLLHQQIKEQEERIAHLEGCLQALAEEQTSKETQSPMEGTQRPALTTLSTKSYAQVAAEKKLEELEVKVNSLTTKQACMEKERDRLQRKCNVIVGNLVEGGSASEDKKKVSELLQDKLEADIIPLDVRRIGKKVEGKVRITLVKLRSEVDKIQLLKKANALKGSKLYLAEDLTIDERKERRRQVEEMKKARADGKRAFIRFSDGKLIVDGKVTSPPPPVGSVNSSVNA